MNKLVLGGLAAMAIGVTACGPTTPDVPVSKPGSSAPPSEVASAPSAAQNRNNVLQWHLKGGDAVEVPLTVDLNLANQDWLQDDIKRQTLTSYVIKDTKDAMDYGPIPDPQMQAAWVEFLRDFKNAGDHLQSGQYDNATADFQNANKAYKKIYDRNQAIFAGE